MSLLLKALKQAEVAKAADPELLSEDRVPEPTALPQREALRAREWVEPPGLLFGKAAEPRPPANWSSWQRPALLPALAVLALGAALAYTAYVQFALESTPLLTTPRSPPPGVAVPAALAAAAPATAPARPADEAVAAAPDVVQARPPAVEDRRKSRASPVATVPAPPPAAESAPVFQPDVQGAKLDEAYAAYQDGRLDVAERLYTEAAARRRSVDALLGLAAIASVQNRDGDAQRLYREVLERDPQHALAQAALLDLSGGDDSAAVEHRLRALIAREPTPQLYQTLGHHYAGQERWKDAQASYFEAYRGAPDSADYAYNLAVGLDRLHQYPAALRYYEKALAGSGAHRFDRAQVQARVQQLNQLDAEGHGTP